MEGRGTTGKARASGHSLRENAARNGGEQRDQQQAAHLVCLQRRRELEDYAAIIVLLLGGDQVEIGERDFARVSGREIEERGADDGVVPYFKRVAIFKNEDSWILSGLGIGERGIRLAGVRRGDIFDRRDVGAGALSAAIEDGGSALM